LLVKNGTAGATSIAWALLFLTSWRRLGFGCDTELIGAHQNRGAKRLAPGEKFSRWLKSSTPA
jgi:hypothetical protein